MHTFNYCFISLILCFLDVKKLLNKVKENSKQINSKQFIKKSKGICKQNNLLQ